MLFDQLKNKIVKDLNYNGTYYIILIYDKFKYTKMTHAYIGREIANLKKIQLNPDYKLYV